MNDTAPSAFGSLANIFFEPRKTLDVVRNSTSWWWLPFFLLIGFGAVLSIWYARHVDATWFGQETLAPDAARMTADVLRQRQAQFTPTSMIVFGLINSLVAVPIWYLLQTLYFFLVAKAGGFNEQRFGAWFSFITWTNMPALFAYIASAAYLLSNSSNQITPVEMDITSLNTLLFHVPYAHTGQFIASTVRLTLFWSWGLMIIGMASWTGKSIRSAAVTVLTPYVVLYVIFIAKALLLP